MGKKTKGRKRHIVVDTMGNLLAVVIHAANIHDTIGGQPTAALAVDTYQTIVGMCADAGYRKSFEIYMKWDCEIIVDISERITPSFQILPKRWVVERTLAWFGNSRRLAKDYEISCDSAASMVKISHWHTLIKRIA